MQREEVLRHHAWCSRVTFSTTWATPFFLLSLSRFVFRCPVAVRYMSLSYIFPCWRKNVPDRLKHMLWAICGNPSWATIRDRECSKSVPMQRGARFWIFDVPLGVQHGLSEGVRNMYKTNAFLHILKTNPERMARQKRRRKTQIFKIR